LLKDVVERFTDHLGLPGPEIVTRCYKYNPEQEVIFILDEEFSEDA
jgi:hypothetical protein